MQQWLSREGFYPKVAWTEYAFMTFKLGMRLCLSTNAVPKLFTEIMGLKLQEPKFSWHSAHQTQCLTGMIKLKCHHGEAATIRLKISIAAILWFQSQLQCSSPLLWCLIFQPSTYRKKCLWILIVWIRIGASKIHFQNMYLKSGKKQTRKITEVS